MTQAFLFPGQGSQHVGMGQYHYENNSEFAGYFDRASDILGFDIKKIMFEGPEDELKQTEVTQPAIFLHSVALYNILTEAPAMVAGHSLGEFSALAAAGALTFEDGLRIVRKRGKLMQDAGESTPGTMAAVIGMADEDVASICAVVKQRSGKEVVPANYNSPGQVVISGDQEAVQEAMEEANEQGCRLTKELPVSGAFHSALMKPAYDGLKNELEQVDLAKPSCPVYCNYTGKPTEDPDELRSNLLNQLLNPVRWRQSVEAMAQDGAEEFVEVGPGKVLQGLVKRTVKKVNTSGHQ